MIRAPKRAKKHISGAPGAVSQLERVKSSRPRRDCGDILSPVGSLEVALTRRKSAIQMRDYPRLVAERAWRRLAGNKEWITLERFVAQIAAFNNIETATALIGAAIIGKSFLNAHHLPQIFFLPQPTSFSARSEAWRVSATEYIDTATRFAKIDMLDWYLKSIWVPAVLAQEWCRANGYDIQLIQASEPISFLTTSTELQGKPGPKEYEVWSYIEDRFFFFMNTHGEFSRERGWYQKKLIDRISEELQKDNKPVPDPTGFKKRFKKWLPRWRAAIS
jgi:hypothetical protein